VTDEFLAAQAALHWLKSQQQDDGSYGNVGTTLDTIMAVAAAGEDVDAWRSGAGNSMIDYLRAGVSPYNYTTAYVDNIDMGPSNTGKLALALAAAGLDPIDFEGLDLSAKLSGYYNPTTGAFVSNGYGWWQALAMMGWQASGETIPVTATNFLKGTANADGGWGYPGWGSDPDTTGMVLQGLIAGGEPVTATSVISALAYLAETQDESGGFINMGIPNANSTSLAVLGLLAADEDPVGPAWTTAISNSHPISYLLDVQLSNGSFTYDDVPNLVATQQAVWALSGKPFPYFSKAVALRKAVEWIAVQQKTDGGFGGGASSNAAGTMDAILALAAAGEDPQDFVTGGKTPLDYLATQVPTYTTTADKVGKMIVSVAAARGNPQSFAGRNLVADLMTYYQSSTGSFGTGNTWEQSWALLGLAAVGEPIPAEAVDYLKDIQNDSDHGWGFYPEGASWGTDSNSTALALQALAAADVDLYDDVITNGFGYLVMVSQASDGGFQYQVPYGTDPSSTGLGLQALAAYEWVPRGLVWSTRIADGTSSRLPAYNPLDTLVGLQESAGSFPGYDQLSATCQAVPGLAGKAFPFRISWVYLPIVMRAL
jgi:prenyltransferase beta subunit